MPTAETGEVWCHHAAILLRDLLFREIVGVYTSAFLADRGHPSAFPGRRDFLVIQRSFETICIKIPMCSGPLPRLGLC